MQTLMYSQFSAMSGALHTCAPTFLKMKPNAPRPFSQLLEALNTNFSVRETLKKVGAAFLTEREISAQECVYRCLPELWMRKIFPGTLFLNTDLPDSRLRMRNSERDLEELDDDSTDIYKHNILD